MLPLVAAGVLSCAKQEIVFDHEKQAFESRDGLILIEGIMPQASTADEEIYIVGPFNGFVGPFFDEEGEALVDFQNSAYLMERSAVIPQKWGVYLDPEDFVGGATLEDGFTFISATQGEERDSRGNTVLHKLNIKAGEWANVYVDKWAKYFQKDPGPKPLPTHDGVRIYVVDETGWPELALYMWGDKEFCGGWPGAQVTGTLNYEGVNYKYFEFGSDLFGLTEHLIFNNNNNGSQLKDWDVVFESGVSDYFVKITTDGVEPLDGPTPEDIIPPHDGKIWVSIIDKSEYPEIALYMWGGMEYCGGWPGMLPTGTFEYKGETWKYFELGTDIIGNTEHLIFNNNNNGSQLKDYDIVFDEETVDYLLVVTADGVTPYGDEPEPEPEPDPKNDPVTIYIDNQVGYEELAIYMHGDAELCGKWPGLAPSKTEDIVGVTYSVFVVEDAMERAENIILNNNGGGSQLADFAVTFTKDTYYFTATADGLVEIDDPHPAGEPSVLYIAQDCGWESVALYAWGDQECFGKWPGKTPDSSVSLCGVEYSVWNLGAEFYGLGENLILNNNDGQQADGPKVTLGTDLVYSIDADKKWTLVENPTVRVYVINETGWDELHLYSWGGGEYFGGWPGATPAGKQTVGGVEYDYFDVPAEAFAAAGDCNFIFNNNAGTQYENDPGLKGNKADRDHFFHLTTEGASVIE